MAERTIEVRKLSPALGAEIHGVDLSRPLSADQKTEIYNAWMENLVLVFRDQAIDRAQHLAFGRNFGPLHVHPATALPGDDPEILVVKADENSTRVAGEDWHSDVSCEAEPPMGSLLFMSIVPPDGGGDTMFANMYLAYETLSDPIKHLIQGRRAVHDGKPVFDRPGYREDKRFPRAEHPIVRTHPVTGRQALFVNRVFTTQIVGLNKTESDAILEMLFRQIETPEYSVRIHWLPNSMTCWDNRCAQHRALWDYFPHQRYAERVTVAGDRPFYDPAGNSLSSAPDAPKLFKNRARL
jgi:taurine dioxygenase